MTPLAQHLLNDWCSRHKKVHDLAGIVPVISGAKCFEVSAISDMTDQIMVRTSDLLSSGRIFLPAPITFIEFDWSASNIRTGVLLREEPDGFFSMVTATEKVTSLVGFSDFKDMNIRVSLEHRNEIAEATFKFVVACLFLINTPNLTGKITHAPGYTLQRKIAARMPMSGRFPLQAWTEITLFSDPSGRRAAEENEEVEARLTGEKCLHFVRAFLRYRMGRLEVVKSHWRGDASLGIKRSRYIVKPDPSLTP